MKAGKITSSCVAALAILAVAIWSAPEREQTLAFNDPYRVSSSPPLHGTFRAKLTSPGGARVSQKTTAVTPIVIQSSDGYRVRGKIAEREPMN